MMGLAWAAVWLPAGLVSARLIVGELDPEHIAGPLYGGFICGTIFCGLGGIASGARRLDQLSPYRAAVWGVSAGLIVGVLPFVLGDNGRYQAGWSSLIVAASALAAGVSAGRRRSSEWSPVRAASLAAGVTGLLSGVLPWIVTARNSVDALLPVAIIGGLSGLSAVSAFLSPPIARWLRTHQSATSAPTP
jgi:hypothetical protein